MSLNLELHATIVNRKMMYKLIQKLISRMNTHLSNGSAIFEPNLFSYDNLTFLKPSSFYTQLLAYEDGTERVF